MAESRLTDVLRRLDKARAQLAEFTAQADPEAGEAPSPVWELGDELQHLGLVLKGETELSDE